MHLNLKLAVILAASLSLNLLLAVPARAQVSAEDAYRRMEEKAQSRKQAESRAATAPSATLGASPATVTPENAATPPPKTLDSTPPSPLLAARRAFKTKLLTDGSALNDEHAAPDNPPPGSYKLVRFPSPAGNLRAYLTPDPKDGKKHPAVIWVHGGFGGIGEYIYSDNPPDNDQSPRQFRETEFVVMAPSRRGENDNPGQQEMFYGEVDDTLAAIDYLSKQPYVDSSRIYLVGHSTGGTVALLTAECTNKLRAVFSLGGCPDMDVFLDAPKHNDAPFDFANPTEAKLRSAAQFVDSLQCPTWYFEGDNSAYSNDALDMQRRAVGAGLQFKTYIMRGQAATHFTIIKPITRLLAARLKDDAGPICNFKLTTDEIATALNTELNPGEKIRCVTASTDRPATIKIKAVVKDMLTQSATKQGIELDKVRFIVAKRDGEVTIMMTLDKKFPGRMIECDGLRMLVDDELAAELPENTLIDVLVDARLRKFKLVARDAGKE